VFVSGYWDYAVPRRGLLFAPVYIERAAVVRPAFAYRPTVVVNTAVLVDNLFVRPKHCHYYFGDYHAAEYRRVGILPAPTFHRSHHGYSAIYASAVSHHRRQDPRWEDRVIRDYDFRRDHADARPPRTFAALERARKSDRGADSGNAMVAANLRIARPVSELTTSPTVAREIPVRITRTAPDSRPDMERRMAQLRDYRTQRQKLEVESAAKSPARQYRVTGREGGQRTPPTTDQRPSAVPRGQEKKAVTGQGQGRDDQQTVQPLRLNLRRSPVAGRPLRQPDKTATPSKQPAAPKADPNVRPRSRAAVEGQEGSGQPVGERIRRHT
jgi:hypothetical protein